MSEREREREGERERERESKLSLHCCLQTHWTLLKAHVSRE